MKILLVVGGYGTRFWPASRRKNPKQHQRVISRNKSLVQLKYSYLSKGFSPRDIFVVTGEQYSKEIRKQLPKIPRNNFIIEPLMKDTGPAVALGVLKIHQLFPKELVSIQWSDHYIRDPRAFVRALKEGAKIALKTTKDVIIGIPARFPTPHRGYIKVGKKLEALNHNPHLVLCEFKKFIEKPTLSVAQEYIASGNYVWNPGYFIVHPQNVLAKYKKFAPDLFSGFEKIKKALGTKQEDSILKNAYAKFEKQAFEYIYPENLNPEEALVIDVEMGWSDVGEWNSLKETLQDVPNANVTKGLVHHVDCEDTLLYNYERGKLLTGIDLKGYIVVNTSDAILVCPQDSVGKIKKLLKTFDGTRLEKYT